MPDEGMATMENDLAAVYTKAEEGDLTRGVSRQTVADIKAFYASRVQHFSRMPMNCTDCRYLRGAYCQHYRDTVPEAFRATGCDDWQWDGVPF